MHEMEQQFDPDVRNFFIRILNAISWIVLWFVVFSFTGLYLGMALGGNKLWVTLIFYTVFIISTIFIGRRIFRLLTKAKPIR